MKLNKIKDYPGHFTNEEAVDLYRHAIKVPKNGIVVELGCFYGKSSIVLAEAGLKTGSRLFSIDNFCTDGEPAKKHYEENVLNKYENTTLIVGDTNKVIKNWKRKIDLLFIDANHQDEGINEDCKNWLPLLKKGGVVAFHDYHNDLFPNVKKRVDEHTKDYEFLSTVDTIYIMRK